MYNFKNPLNTSLENGTDLTQYPFVILFVKLIVSEDGKAMHCPHWLGRMTKVENGTEWFTALMWPFQLKCSITTMLRSSKDERQSNVCILILFYRS